MGMTSVGWNWVGEGQRAPCGGRDPHTRGAQTFARQEGATGLRLVYALLCEVRPLHILSGSTAYNVAVSR